MPDRLKVRNMLSYGILKCTNKDDILRSEPDYYEVVVHHWLYGLNCMKRSPKFTLFMKDDRPPVLRLLFNFPYIRRLRFGIVERLKSSYLCLKFGSRTAGNYREVLFLLLQNSSFLLINGFYYRFSVFTRMSVILIQTYSIVITTLR